MTFDSETLEPMIIPTRFKDIKPGQHFKEVGRERKFIKLMDVLPSGQTMRYVRESGDLKDSFNAVDYEGIPAKCPDSTFFEVLP